MIALVSFSDLEESLFRKASAELEIGHRIFYFAGIDRMIAAFAENGDGKLAGSFPRAIVMNMDAPSCIMELGRLKETEKWQKIPVIGYGFLEAADDITGFYGAGGASCIRKPQSYEELVETTRAAMGYWLSMSTLPCDYLREA